MKLKLHSMLLPVAAALILAGCQDLMSDSGGVTNADDSVTYSISAAIALPSTAGTRSGTDDTENGSTNTGGDQTNSDATPTDYEYGYDYENDVRSMILLIATTDGKYITHTVVDGITKVQPGERYDFTVTAEIKHSDLVAAYENSTLLSNGNDDPKKVCIWAYCNYTTTLLEDLNTCTSGSEDWQDFKGSVTEAASPAGHTPDISNTIWAPRSFLMTNAVEFTTQFPGKIGDWDDYADKNNPFDINSEEAKASHKAIPVERAAARIDFRRAAGHAEDPDKDLFKLKADTDNDGPNLFNIKLTRMALVNMSKDFYYLRRVSGNGLNEGSKIGGAENRSNYVVDTDAAIKNAIRSSTSKNVSDDGGEDQITPENAGTYFNFPLFKSAKEDGKYPYDMYGWYTDSIEDVVNEGKEDTWSGSESDKYHIWRYVTENTIPGGDDYDHQQTVQSTGVIFKGSIFPGADIDATHGASGPRYASEAVEIALTAASQHLTHNSSADPVTSTGELVGKGKGDKFNYPILYSFNGLLYAGVDELVLAAANDGINGPLYNAVEQVLNHWYIEYTPDTDEPVKETFEYNDSESGPQASDGNKIQPLTVRIYAEMLKNKSLSDGSKTNESGFGHCSLSEKGFGDGNPENDPENDPECYFMKHAPKDGKITIYKASEEEDGEGWGYYCYYFYWNRHNDNNQSGRMGRMEFATVRNNVYKLSVTGIGKLGHPRIPAYDPDPVDPNDPDEEPVDYITVKVEVLPWVVRVNNIEF